MSIKKWAKSVIAKQPVYDSKETAIQAAIKANKEMAVNEIWQEPNDGRYVVAAPEAFEALYREKYTRILDSGQISDIERGDDVDEIEEEEGT